MYEYAADAEDLSQQQIYEIRFTAYMLPRKFWLGFIAGCGDNKWVYYEN